MKTLPTPKILDETVVYFTDAKQLPGMPSISQVHNWAYRGLCCRTNSLRVYLEWAYLGPRLATSAEAVRRFFRRVNGETD